MTWEKNYTAAAVLRALAWKPCRAALRAPRSPASLKPAATLRSSAGTSSSAAAQPCLSRSPAAGARYAPSAAGTRVGPASGVPWHQQGAAPRHQGPACRRAHYRHTLPAQSLHWCGVPSLRRY